MINAELGEFGAAERAAARARTLAERSGDPNALADADIFEGMSLAMQGRHDEALALAQRGAAGAAAVGNRGCEAVGSLLAGEQELALGKLGPAIDWLEKANDIAGYCQAVDVGRMSAATLGVARAKAGGGAEALHGLDELLDQVRAADDSLSEARILLRRAEANATVENGDPVQARADLEASMAILRAIETPALPRPGRAPVPDPVRPRLGAAGSRSGRASPLPVRPPGGHVVVPLPWRTHCGHRSLEMSSSAAKTFPADVDQPRQLHDGEPGVNQSGGDNLDNDQPGVNEPGGDYLDNDQPGGQDNGDNAATRVVMVSRQTGSLGLLGERERHCPTSVPRPSWAEGSPR